LCGPSASEQALSNQAGSFSTTLQNNYGSQFANQNSVLSALNASLSPTVAGGPSQQGWSPAQAAAVNTNILDTTAANYQNAQRASQTALAGRGGGAANSNIAASGIDSQIGASYASQAAGQTASEENQALQANYAQGNANYNNAVGNQEKSEIAGGITSLASTALTGGFNKLFSGGGSNAYTPQQGLGIQNALDEAAE
jgi:hypothetical protein